MSLRWIETEVEIMTDEVMRKPVTDHELQEGQQLLERVEQLRQRRIREASTEGAAPYVPSSDGAIHVLPR